MDVVSCPNEVDTIPNPTKRRKTSGDVPKIVTKRRKGKLSKLPDMPLDVLYEIFSHLHPQDILRISWTTKSFRRVLTSTSCKTVWMSSFASLEGLPACPDGLNEVEYASLLFNPLCQRCSKSRATIAWAICRRICKDCQEIETVCVGDVWATYPGLYVTLKQFSKTLSQVLPTYRLSARPRNRRSWDPVVFLRTDVEALFERIGDGGLSTSSFGPIIDEYVQHLTKRNMFVSAGQLWEVRKGVENYKAKERLKSQRYEKVKERLKKEGWAEELEKYPSAYMALEDVSGVRITRPLTDKGWESLKPPILTWMNDKKAQRIRRERELLTSRVNQLAHIIRSRRERIDPLLREEDIYWAPDIKTILTEGSAEQFEGLKSGLVDRLPTFAAESKKSRAAALLALLPYENPPMEKLSLGTTWFKCENDRCPPLIFKAAMVHRCFKRSSSDVSEADKYYMDLVGRPWALGPGTSFYERKAKFAKELILAAGGDPETMNHEDIDRQQYRFVQHTDTAVAILSFYSMVKRLESGPDEILYWRALGPEETMLGFGSQPFSSRS